MTDDVDGMLPCRHAEASRHAVALAAVPRVHTGRNGVRGSQIDDTSVHGSFYRHASSCTSRFLMRCLMRLRGVDHAPLTLKYR